MAARFCSKCGHEIASTAQFCPNCGTAVGSGGPGVTRVEAATDKTRRLLVPGMVAALVVLVIAVALLAARPHQAVTSASPQPILPAPSVLNAPSAPLPSAPAVTNAPSQPVAPAPAVTNSASKPAPSLPPEDARYLEFLRGIEQRRVALDSDTSMATAMQSQVSGLQDRQADPEQQEGNLNKSLGKIDQGYSDYQMKYQLLIRDFRAVPAPVDCTQIANKYLVALTDYADIISKAQVILKNINVGSSPDFGALMKAQAVLQEAQTQVNTDLTGADQEITALCARFGVPKPFDIKVAGGSSPLTGL